MFGPSDTSISITSPEEALLAFERARPRLFGIAYRIVKDRMESEDIVQEAWLRWHSCNHEQVREPTAFLAQIATRLAINIVTSGRARHERRLGPWLIDSADAGPDPLGSAAHDESLEQAMKLLTAKLTLAERAAFISREAFGYPYSRIAFLLRTSETAVRQLVCRARKHLVDAQTRRSAPPADHKPLLLAFLSAARSGEMAPLESLLFAECSSQPGCPPELELAMSTGGDCHGAGADTVTPSLFTLSQQA